MPSDTNAKAVVTDDTSKTQRVYLELRRRIRELELPPGARLNKNDIADEFGVSRAPVSDALARLAEEGLVDVFPQNGSFVAPIRDEDIRESMLIRTALEIEAIRQVTEIADDDLIARLSDNLERQKKAVEGENMSRLDELDEAFHSIIMEALDAPRLQRLLDGCRARLDRPRFHALPVYGRPAATLAEHQRIFDAIRSGDPEYASSAMRVHLKKVAQAIQNDP